jgi:hypothetical protein
MGNFSPPIRELPVLNRTTSLRLVFSLDIFPLKANHSQQRPVRLKECI